MFPRRAAVDKEGARGDQEGGRSSVPVALILVLVVVFPLVVVIAYFASRTVLPELSGLVFSSPQGGILDESLTSVRTLNSSSIQQQVTGQLFSPPSMAFLSPILKPLQVNFVGIVLVVAAAMVGLVAWRGLRTRRRPTPAFDEEGLVAERRRKVSEILDDAAARLNSGSSYRETVLRCYKMISGLLEERTDVDGRTLTAREFEARVSEKLRIETPDLIQVTDLFELARYSERDITKEQARAAAACLSNLSDSLKEIAVSVSDIK